MDNETNKKISPDDKSRHMHHNALLKFNILLLSAVALISSMLIAGCSNEPETYPEAEAAVTAALSEIQEGKNANATMPELVNEVDEDNASLVLYAEKLRDFEYEILGSYKPDTGEADSTSVAVVTRIKTYDFGSVYTKSWLEYLAVEEVIDSSKEFDSNLLYRLASVSAKDYAADVEIICTDSGDGNWKPEIESNDRLMNALSGGMVEAIKTIAAESESKND